MPGDSITLTYLGVGGWLLDTGRSTLLTAPFFSNPSLFRTGLAPIGPDTAAVVEALRYLNVPPLDDVVAILVGHAHHDHLMDVPYVAAHLAPRARILGSTTVRHTLAGFADHGLDTTRVDDVSAFAADLAGGGHWIEVAPDLRVLPLVSDHAPHFQGITLYEGTRTRPLSAPPRAAEQWLEGETLAFLIDVLDETGAVRLRIYYQDAVARAPWGLMPDSLAPVDVALIVPATYAEVYWHPEAVLENTRARHVLLGHWEDFFRPATAEPEPVPFTLLPDFVARLRRALEGDDSRWALPVPGTRFVLY
jgi:L-ascorbate metabolism protein UlaG (beta-lactamase superfamily)